MHFSSTIKFILRTQQNHTISSMNTCILIPTLHLYINTFPKNFIKGLLQKLHHSCMYDSVFGKVIPQAFGHLNSWSVQPPLWSANYYICIYKIAHPSILSILVIGPSFNPFIVFVFSLVFPLAASVKAWPISHGFSSSLWFQGLRIDEEKIWFIPYCF